MTRRLPVLALSLFALTVVACGDDEPARAATAVKGDAFCTAAAEVDALTDGMSEALFGGDPAAFETALDALVASAEAAQKIAPTDVEARITKSVNGFKDLRTGLKKFNFDFEAAAADPEFAALLEDPDLEANGNEIDAYLSEKCGIAPG